MLTDALCKISEGILMGTMREQMSETLPTLGLKSRVPEKAKRDQPSSSQSYHILKMGKAAQLEKNIKFKAMLQERKSLNNSLQLKT